MSMLKLVPSLILASLFSLALYISPLAAETIIKPADELSPQEQAEFEQLKAEFELQRSELDQRRAALEQAVEEMHKASQEMARLSHEMRVAPDASNEFIWVSESRHTVSQPSASIGILISQDGDINGPEIVGLTPGGPAESAGLQKGDQVLSINGTDLLPSPGPERMEILIHELSRIEAGNQVSLTLLRGEKPMTVNITAEKRNPAGLHTLIRPPRPPMPPIASSAGLVIAPHAVNTPNADEMVIIQRSISDIDGIQNSKHIIVKVEGRDGMVAGLEGEEMERHIKLLEQRLENMEIDIDIENFPGAPEMSNFEVIIGQATENAIFFFDSNMVSGLELAPLNPGLGKYFKVDSGVLVLDARADNSLNLAAGDVITAVGSQEIFRPADLMRNLRFLKDGEKISLEVIRSGQSLTVESQPVDKSIQRLHSPQ